MTDSTEVAKRQVGPNVEALRQTLLGFADVAVATVKDLMLHGESEKVRLQAAESVLDRVGVDKKNTMVVHADRIEHQQVTEEAEAIMAKLQRNAEAQTKKEIEGAKSVETLLVLEDESDELPVAGPIDESSVIEVDGGTAT